MCVIWICVSFLFTIEYPLTAPPPHKAYLLPPGTTQHKHTCALWHFPPLVSLFFHAPSCFPLSCLSLVFFPVYLSPYNSPLSKICFMLLPPTLFLCSPSCAPSYSHSLSFLLKFSLLHSPASLTGTKERFELTPVAAISVHLLASDGVELQVNEPITVSVPLPADSGLKENDHIPAWRFDPRLGMYWQKHKMVENVLLYMSMFVSSTKISEI